MGFSGSDLPVSEKPKGLLALGAVTNRSPYTRFSQDGGGQLEGFEDGEPGQYRVNQWTAETAFKYLGFSWQQEYHWKEIDDRVNSAVTTLAGNYFQLGYFFNQVFESFPKELELAFRHSYYVPDLESDGDNQQEFSFAANWFFNGHLNKLTAEITSFRFRESGGGSADDLRFRFQWDISI
jgi:hypothetical protein